VAVGEALGTPVTVGVIPGVGSDVGVGVEPVTIREMLMVTAFPTEGLSVT